MVEKGLIFLSYRSLDSEFALDLAMRLRRKGIPIWMDRLGGIQVGDDWEMNLEAAIDSSETVGLIAILSPDYISSKNCLRELRRADRLNKSIFPVLIKDVDYFPMPVQDIHYADFRGWEKLEVCSEPPKLDTKKRYPILAQVILIESTSVPQIRWA